MIYWVMGYLFFVLQFILVFRNRGYVRESWFLDLMASIFWPWYILTKLMVKFVEWVN